VGLFALFDCRPKEEYYKERPERAFKIAKIYSMSITNYFRDVRAEMKHVSWPSRRLTIVYTIVVALVSIATAVYLGLLDYAFSAVIKTII
jgi:preprotein translocase subunit SecE